MDNVLPGFMSKVLMLSASGNRSSVVKRGISGLIEILLHLCLTR